MVLLLIPIVWFTVVAFFVILCRVAASGDAVPAPRAERSRSHVIAGGLVVRELSSDRVTTFG